VTAKRAGIGNNTEDAILPAWEMKATHGDRIAVLGRFDLDKLCRITEPEVRKHTWFLIDNCAAGGGWALGTGDSVANYVPVSNFLAMLEEGFKASTNVEWHIQQSGTFDPTECFFDLLYVKSLR
jgi:hypothetical protein